MSGNLAEYLSSVSLLIDMWAEKRLVSAKPEIALGLYDSMRYSMSAGGKKIRPALLLCAYNLFDKRELDVNHPALPYATGLEMIHTYSLIHDDLPAMDNDDMRRGKPTNHKLFGEATAILAGDGLLTQSFAFFLDKSLSPSIYPAIADSRRIAAALALAESAMGMVCGQYTDMVVQGELDNVSKEARRLGSDNDIDLVNYINAYKTGQLIAGALIAGGILGGATDGEIAQLKEYGFCIGAAFQLTDDLLDIYSTTEELGKPARSDEKSDKLTYLKINGAGATKKEAKRLSDKAIGSISAFTGYYAELLKELAEFVIDRRS